MKKSSKWLIGTGILSAVAGAGTSVLSEIQANKYSDNSAVRRHDEAWRELMQAHDEWNRVPQDEKLLYTPQSQRYDYSAGAAHSQVEHAAQRLYAGRTGVNLASNNKDPEFIECLNNRRNSGIGFAVGAFGAFLTYLGFKKR